MFFFFSQVNEGPPDEGQEDSCFFCSCQGTTKNIRAASQLELEGEEEERYNGEAGIGRAGKRSEYWGPCFPDLLHLLLSPQGNSLLSCRSLVILHTGTGP
jgi:hypothetical protein